MAQFPNVERAVDAVQEILTSEYGSHIRMYGSFLPRNLALTPFIMILECVELMDDAMMEAVNAGGTLDPSKKLPAVDSLFFKLQGSKDSIAAAAKLVKSITKKHGSTRFEFASSDEEAALLWQNRKEALYATLSSNPGMKCWTTDVW
jgi:D-lactate dehydrogenase (cytochrome)